MSLASKRALVTGGSRGIGLGIAHRLASLGASTVLVSRSETALQAAVKTLPAGSSQSHSFLTGDVGNVAFWDGVKRAHSDIDILVNAAGVTHSSLLMATRPDTIDAVLRTNLTGTILACRAVARGMLRRRAGCIVNISSILALNRAAGSSAYAASKAGIVGLTRSLAAEYGRSGIRTNAVLPGYIETEMTQGMSELAREEALKGTPLGRYGTVEEVADVVEFLVRCGFVNGAEVAVDGGLRIG